MITHQKKLSFIFLFACAATFGASSPKLTNQTLAYECQDKLMFTIKQQGSQIWFVHLGLATQLFVKQTKPQVLMSKSGAIKLQWQEDDVQLDLNSKQHNDCRRDRVNATWENAKLSGVHFRAVGNEPGWHFNITNEQRLDFVTDYGETKVTFLTNKVLYQHDAKSTHFQLTSGKHTLKVTISKKQCLDDMSGEAMQAEVDVVFDGRKLSGCGNPLQDTSGDV